MKLKSLVAAAAMLVAGVSGAWAVPLTLGTAVNGVLTASPTQYSFSVPLVGGAVDFMAIDYSFSGSIGSFSVTGPLGAVAPTSSLVNGGSVAALSFGSLSAGAYTLSIGGGVGTGYRLTSAFTPAVPEAGSMALALAGLGVAGLMLRRRSSV
jgi:MYXO-CTERM domain-containing protein